MLTAHFGPWEAGSTVSLVVPDQTFVAVYHKLTNPVIDELMKRIRQHTNVELVDMKHTMRHFIDNRNKRPMAMGLIADQNPVLRANMHWYKFLHQWTAFFEGGETLALKYHLPVYYFSPKRLSAGHYEGNFTLIYDGEEQVEPYTITERYVRLLENDINANPEMWMWSHRRWKHTPPAELQAQKI
jgi:KDO2-lipid IV(A) lauroyltransferase